MTSGLASAGRGPAASRAELPAEPLHHRDAVKSGIADVLDRIVRR
ncbi:hypothetical protein P8A22_16695 [Streptomyces laculatispora]|uniref:Uncharacterized protein n=1 Tax=Streptomyces laculatispora TaxID=887464 RepID=A0ABY9I3S3_9ACTN|nr:hypothetical protein [Streptomyces laculatispora]WLQ41481.1 hypothetical protein P8A22_16695 [Streptomyces laculatispora]